MWWWYLLIPTLNNAEWKFESDNDCVKKVLTQTKFNLVMYV